jgi:hypothetical protein
VNRINRWRKAGEWFLRGRFAMVSPDAQPGSWLLSGRKSTYRLVQTSGATSVHESAHLLAAEKFVAAAKTAVSGHFRTLMHWRVYFA